MKSKLFNVFIFLFSTIVLVVTLRGNIGNPTSLELNTPAWKDGGPFELSPERGRFALTYSVVENQSVIFSLDLARFVTPDLGYINGNYVSLFAPGVSFITIPGYLVGRSLGISQVGTYAVVAAFALLNFILIRKISSAMGANYLASSVAGLIFLFATPAFTYAVSLYQHHISAFLILLACYLLIRPGRILVNLVIIWFLCAFSILIDYPNLFMMLPIALASLTKFFQVERVLTKFKIKFNFGRLLTLSGIVVPFVMFMVFSYLSYGNPLQFSGTVPSAAAIGIDGKPTAPRSVNLEGSDELADQVRLGKSAINFFYPRNLVNGFYIHFLSLDRGVLMYTPIILFGVLGALILYKSLKSNKNIYLSVLVGVIAINIVLYSLWGDPWGGWAFGSRYLIPSYAVLSIFISIALTRLSKSKILLSLFSILMVYSIAINTLGAVTTSANPPKTEISALEQLSGTQERYTYARNWEYLKTTGSKAFFYRQFFSDRVDVKTFYFVLVGILSAISIGLIYANYNFKKQNR